MIDADGTRHISNYAIVTDPQTQENFDFTGGGPIAKLANDYLKPRIDPWGIGRKVNINFVGSAPTPRDYTYANYMVDTVKHADEVALGLTLLGDALQAVALALHSLRSHSCGHTSCGDQRKCTARKSRWGMLAHLFPGPLVPKRGNMAANDATWEIAV